MPTLPDTSSTKVQHHRDDAAARLLLTAATRWSLNQVGEETAWSRSIQIGNVR